MDSIFGVWVYAGLICAVEDWFLTAEDIDVVKDGIYLIKDSSDKHWFLIKKMGKRIRSKYVKTPLNVKIQLLKKVILEGESIKKVQSCWNVGSPAVQNQLFNC